MYHTIDVARSEVADRVFVCIQLYSYDGDYLDCVISPQADVDSVVIFIDAMKERHNLASIRIATDIREVLQRYVEIPGYLALYATPGDLSRAYRLLREDSEYLQLAIELAEPAEIGEEQSEYEEVGMSEKLTLLQRIYRRVYEWLNNLLKRMNIVNKSKERSRS